MKKMLSLALTVILSLGALTACGGGAPAAPSGEATPAPAPSTETPAASGDITLAYALWDSTQAPVIEELARKFEAENPGIKIEFQLTPWKDYWTKLETTVTAKAAPDVFWMNIPRATDYIANGILLPLDELSVDISKFPATHIEAYTREGKLYGIPRDFDTVAIFYNKTLFQEAGVPEPTASWTWADMKDAAAKITNKEKGIYGIAAPAEWQGGYYEAIYQNGSDPFTADGKSNFLDPAVIEALEYWYSFVADGQSPGSAELQNTPAADLLMSGRLGIFPDGSWNVPVFFGEQYGKDNIDVAVLPKGKRNGTTSNALSNVIYSGSKNIDAAKKWVEFLSSAESNKFIAESGVVIPAYEGTQEAWINQYPDKNVRAFVDSVQFATHLPNIPNFSAAQAFEYEYLVPVWNGEMSVSEACKLIAEKANEALGK